MKPKGVIKRNPALAPWVRTPRNANPQGTQTPAAQPAANNPLAAPVQQTPLVPTRTYMHTQGGWYIFSEPVTYSQYQGVIFLEFQKPDYVGLTATSTNTLKLKKLNLEINSLLRQHNKKIVLELPPIWISFEVSNALGNMNRVLQSQGGILVLHYGKYHPQASFFPTWGFNIGTDINHAGQIAQAGHMVAANPTNVSPAQILSSTTIPQPQAGSWQILNPTLDPNYPGIFFLDFSNPHHAQLTNPKDLETLSDELDAISNNPGQKIVFELPPTRIGKEVLLLLLGNFIITEESGKFIFYLPSWSTKGQALQDLEFNVARTKAGAASLTQTQTVVQNTSSILTGGKIYPSSNPVIPPPKCGYWQVFNNEPYTDPKYPGIYFANFHLPDYVKMNSQQDIHILANELDAIADDLTRRIVIELPDVPMSKDVIRALIATNIFISLFGGKVVYLFPSWTNQAKALEELSFDVFIDRDLAANCALGPSSPLLAQYNQNIFPVNTPGIASVP